MESRAKLFGHPIHPVLIVFPLGLLGTAVLFDIIGLIAGNNQLFAASFYMIAAGVIGGLVAAVFGLWDWLAIPLGTRAKRVGLVHAGANVAALTLFAISWLMRYAAQQTGGGQPTVTPEGIPVILGVIGLGIALFGGWLGGELIHRLDVSIDRGAHLNSPSSLSGRPASDDAGTPTAPATQAP
jgi:uncharacterized membrane protein